MTHTPTPWKRSNSAKLCILGGPKGHGKTVCVLRNLQDPDVDGNAARIVATANFCEGYTTEQIESGELEIVPAGTLAALELASEHFAKTDARYDRAGRRVDLTMISGVVRKAALAARAILDRAHN